jgi:sulfonate transport system permease protein
MRADAVARGRDVAVPAATQGSEQVDNNASLQPFFGRRWRRVALGLVVPGLSLAFWEWGVRHGLIDGRLMPPPSRVLALAIEMMRGGDLFHHIAATLLRVAIGALIGVGCGTFVGIASGASRTIHAMIDPTVQALRAIPSIAWVPLFILWFGIFEKSKIVLIALGAFFPVYLATTEAVLSADRKLIEVGHALRLPPIALLRHILVPLILPAWVVSLRTALGLAFMFVVAAEIMGASEGLGYPERSDRRALS